MTRVGADALRVVVTTCPEASAEALIEGVLGRRLAACCNRLPGVASTYWWQGQLTTEQECLLLFKTTVAGLDPLCEEILALHPYEVPEVLVLPVEGAAATYAAWVQDEVAGPKA